MKPQRLDATSAMEDSLFDAPPVPSRIKIWRFQWIGIPILVLLPILALFGIFDRGTKIIILNGASFQTQVQYPAKLRHGEEDQIRIEVTNTSRVPLERVTAGVNRKFIESFDDVTFTPEVNENYEIVLSQIPPGESRYIDIRIKAGDYWTHKGELTLQQNGIPLRTIFSTFVYP